MPSIAAVCNRAARGLPPRDARAIVATRSAAHSRSIIVAEAMRGPSRAAPKRRRARAELNAQRSNRLFSAKTCCTNCADAYKYAKESLYCCQGIASACSAKRHVVSDGRQVFCRQRSERRASRGLSKQLPHFLMEE